MEMSTFVQEMGRNLVKDDPTRDFDVTCELFRYPNFEGYSEYFTLDFAATWNWETRMRVGSFKCGKSIEYKYCKTEDCP